MKAQLLLSTTIIFCALVAEAQYRTPRYEGKTSSTDTLKYCLKDHSVGVGGYDIISYYQGETPVKGTSEYVFEHDGVTYQFSSLANKALFADNPEKYVPAFGGWCSMTLAMGRATTPVYENFLIIDDRLYLFERTMSVNGRMLWQQDPKTNKQIASRNYEDYLDDGVIAAN